MTPNRIYRDLKYRGTPEDFALYVWKLSFRLFGEAQDINTWVIQFEKPFYDAKTAHVILKPGTRGCIDANRPYAVVDALLHPDGYSKITLTCLPIDWPGIER